jgi:hypothetical protein
MAEGVALALDSAGDSQGWHTVRLDRWTTAEHLLRKALCREDEESSSCVIVMNEAGDDCVIERIAAVLAAEADSIESVD